jgi:hypothetical protein
MFATSQWYTSRISPTRSADQPKKLGSSTSGSGSVTLDLEAVLAMLRLDRLHRLDQLPPGLGGDAPPPALSALRREGHAAREADVVGVDADPHRHPGLLVRPVKRRQQEVIFVARGARRGEAQVGVQRRHRALRQAERL